MTAVVLGEPQLFLVEPSCNIFHTRWTPASVTQERFRKCSQSGLVFPILLLEPSHHIIKKVQAAVLRRETTWRGTGNSTRDREHTGDHYGAKIKFSTNHRHRSDPN